MILFPIDCDSDCCILVGPVEDWDNVSVSPLSTLSPTDLVINPFAAAPFKIEMKSMQAAVQISLTSKNCTRVNTWIHFLIAHFIEIIKIMYYRGDSEDAYIRPP